LPLIKVNLTECLLSDVAENAVSFPYRPTERGALRGVDGVFGLGNVLTGKGNIRDSRVNASVVAERIIENLLGVPDAPDAIDDMSDALHDEFSARAQPIVDRALAGSKLPPEHIAPILERVKRRWDEVGYPGDYRAWIETKRPAS